MITNYADMHIHSYYSDGTLSVDDILQELSSNNVNIFSITDHNDLTSANSILNSNIDNLQYVTGVELDAFYKGNVYHVLGYGYRLNDESLYELANQNKLVQEEINQFVLQLIKKEKEKVSLDEYENYSYDKRNGGWKLLNYLFYKKVTNSIKEGLKYYKKYDATSYKEKFSTVKEAGKIIKKAGGIPVLAHPGVNIKHQIGSEAFLNILSELIDLGLEGVECYYPVHSSLDEQYLHNFCKERKLYATGGTDCHGDFVVESKQKIGGQYINVSKLILRDHLFPSDK